MKKTLFKNKRVLLRIDADVVTTKGKIAADDCFRLDAALPTIKFLLAHGAAVTILAHRGRPAGKNNPELSLAPAEKYLRRKLTTSQNKSVRFLPNTRFDSREETNDSSLAAEWAVGQDIFVNDAFATAHRAHASTVGVTKKLPSFLGLRLARELEILSVVRDHPKKPLAVIIGGVKMETKLPVIKKFLPVAEKIFVVGALANTFLVAQGVDVKKSKYDATGVALAKKLLRYKNIVVPTAMVWQNEQILDAAPATVQKMCADLRRMKTIIWNGPLGKFEEPKFAAGTFQLARYLASLGKKGIMVVAGGGETVSAILQARASRGYTHISTGGGAMLEFLAGKKLPISLIKNKLK